MSGDLINKLVQAADIEEEAAREKDQAPYAATYLREAVSEINRQMAERLKQADEIGRLRRELNPQTVAEARALQGKANAAVQRLVLGDQAETASSVSEQEPCQKCGGAGWVWAEELDHYDHENYNISLDRTKYTCDACAKSSVNCDGDGE